MTNYNNLIKQAESLLELNKDSSFYNITSLANISALLFNSLDSINWLGFYILENDNLVLGPFQGKVACTFIKKGCGVCGTALKEKRIINVKDVHEFPGHIACDSLSNSELVLPIVVNANIKYIFDIDSPLLNRFDNELVNLFSNVKMLLEKNLK